MIPILTSNDVDFTLWVGGDGKRFLAFRSPLISENFVMFDQADAMSIVNRIMDLVDASRGEPKQNDRPMTLREIKMAQDFHKQMGFK